MKIELYDLSEVRGYVELIDSMGSNLTPVNAARVSFGVQKEELDDKDKKLIKYLLNHQHTSPFEHNLISFKFKVPLFVARQHMRHRTWSFNEISRRYTQVNIDFYSPISFRTQHKTNRQASNQDLVNPVLSVVQGATTNWETKASSALQRHVSDSLKLYQNMIDNGIAKEQARMVLPQNLYTTYIGTVNLNNLIKFINLRDHEGAQQEIREVAQACQKIAQTQWPEIMAHYER
tara:strand:- start:448 stop:1146 length:699 start_codon:yes stop_codon:yes gene_type:complete